MLQYGYYLIPQYHLGASWVAYWNKFGRPQTPPKYALGLPDTWWVDTGAEKTIQQKQGEGAK